MTSQPFGALIDIDESSHITDPPAVLRKDPHGLPDLPTAYELDELNKAGRSVGTPIPPKPSGTQTPRTPNELEQSRPPSPDHDDADAVDVVQSWNNPSINRYRLLSACLMNFGNGTLYFRFESFTYLDLGTSRGISLRSKGITDKYRKSHCVWIRES